MLALFVERGGVNGMDKYIDVVHKTFKYIDVVQKTLITPMENLLNTDKETWGSFGKRIYNITDQIQAFSKSSKTTRFIGSQDPEAKEMMHRFITMAKEYLDPDSLEKGDFNLYSTDTLETIFDIISLKNIYERAKMHTVSFSGTYYDYQYTKVCNCRDCGSPIILNYGQSERYKRLIERKASIGKQFHWPTRCLKCKIIKDAKKEMRNPKYNKDYRNIIKANVKRLEQKREVYKKFFGL